MQLLEILHLPLIQLQQQWFTYAAACLQPGIHCFQEKCGDGSQCPLAAFKAARLFSPLKIYEMQPTAQDVDQLSVFPFLSDPTILASLKVELPSYLAKQQISVLIFILLSGGVDMSKIYHNGHLLPRKLQPSSAAAEYFRY